MTTIVDLENLYRDIILDHYRRPRNRGALETPPASRFEGFNPFCGDEIELYLDQVGNDLTDLKLLARGCSISQASASLMGVAVKGKSVEEVRTTIAEVRSLLTSPSISAPDAGELSRLGELSALSGVANFPARIKCALLAWETLAEGLGEIERATNQT